MRKTLFSVSLVIACIAFYAQSIAQPNGLCNNIQLCNDQNFSATEDDDFYAGEFYNSVGDNATAVVRSAYTGGIPSDFDWQMVAYYGESLPGDWYGVGQRLLANFCAIEAFGISDGSTGFGADYYGIFSAALGGGDNSFNFGVSTVAEGSSESASNYGIFSRAVGQGTSYAGYFAGDVTVTGTFNNPSDARLKRNTEKLENSLDLIHQLQAKTYEYKTHEYSFMHLPEGKQYGLIAQDVEKVLPELVNQNIHPAASKRYTQFGDHEKVEYKGVNYMGLIPILVSAMNEQTEIIEEKDRRIAELENEMNDLLDRIETIEKALDIPRDNQASKAYLGQNRPNPANGTTVIEYTLPESAARGAIIVHDMSGKELQTIELDRNSPGLVELTVNNLPMGTYTYTLIADGKVVETKKMVIAN